MHASACGSAHTARVAQQCLHANGLQMIQKKTYLHLTT